MWFEALSGLRINLNKSEILPIGLVDNAQELAVELGCWTSSNAKGEPSLIIVSLAKSMRRT